LCHTATRYLRCICYLYQVVDTFATLSAFGQPVTRTYTLGVSSINIPDSEAHINGWNETAGDWIYNEAKFQQMDMVMDVARQYVVRWSGYM
jgi:hypothetical protein